MPTPSGSPRRSELRKAAAAYLKKDTPETLLALVRAVVQLTHDEISDPSTLRAVPPAPPSTKPEEGPDDA